MGETVEQCKKKDKSRNELNSTDRKAKLEGMD